MAAAEAAPAPAPEASDFYGGGGGLSTGRKLVPWSNWTEWRFVRDGLFSPFPAAALRRVTPSSPEPEKASIFQQKGVNFLVFL
jgi:ribosomal biogenesis protein LAS1